MPSISLVICEIAIEILRILKVRKNFACYVTTNDLVLSVRSDMRFLYPLNQHYNTKSYYSYAAVVKTT